MVYTLCHKDVPVLNFVIEDDEITDVIGVSNTKHLPVGVFKEYEIGVTQKQQFKTWWRNRAIPASRQNLKDALETLGDTTTSHLIAKSFGLSLSDQYWAKPHSSNLKWSDVNFFENDFSEDVGKALFGSLDVADLSSVSLLSPDNTSDGWLKKKWIIDNGERVLLKGGSGESQQEPFNEVLAAEICTRLGIPHVAYSIIEQDRCYYSACRDFVTTDTEFISAWHIKNILKKSTNDSEYTHLLKCCKAAGMNNIQDIERQLCNMFVLDSIIANSDRHLNNFGFIRNADTLEWQGVAPVFDTGTALFHDCSVYDLKEEFAHISDKAKAKPFAKTHQEQIKKLPCAKYCSDLNFENLENISDFASSLFSKNRHLYEKKSFLCSLLDERVRETKRLIREPQRTRSAKYNSSWER